MQWLVQDQGLDRINRKSAPALNMEENAPQLYQNLSSWSRTNQDTITPNLGSFYSTILEIIDSKTASKVLHTLEKFDGEIVKTTPLATNPCSTSSSNK